MGLEVIEGVPIGREQENLVVGQRLFLADNPFERQQLLILWGKAFGLFDEFFDMAAKRRNFL